MAGDHDRASSPPGKDGKVFKTFRLRPETVEQLAQVAQVAGLSPSAVLERLVGEVVKLGPERIRWKEAPHA